MSSTKIPIYRPVLGQEEIEMLTQCVQDEWLSGGKKLKEFEAKMAQLCGVEHAMGCNNGTVALYLGLLALGVRRGYEVIVPDFTFVASANAVALTGATPVFVDVDHLTNNISPDKTEIAITKRTKAIMPVHIYGRAADMGRMLETGRRNDVAIIEDACQGIGVTHKGTPVGGIGDVGCLSFYADKTITTGEGGMVLTNSASIIRACTVLSNQGRTGRGWYVHDEMGYNFRMTDMQAAVGLAQLQRLEWIVGRKQTHENHYRQLLEGTSDMYGLRGVAAKDAVGVVPFRHNIFVADPEGLIVYLAEDNIDAKRVFYPLHRQPCYEHLGLRDADFPNAIWAYEHGVSLPSSPLLTDAEIERVCLRVRAFCKGGSK